MNTYHILNGDSLAEQPQSLLKADNHSVCREVFMDGPLDLFDEKQHWLNRAEYIHQTFSENRESYLSTVPLEFEKLASLNKKTGIYLWFEEDLFCQVNFWFCLDYLNQLKLSENLFWVRPIKKSWIGFGNHNTEELEQAFNKASKISSAELDTFLKALKAYQCNSNEIIKAFIDEVPPETTFLREALEAQIDRLTKTNGLNRPEKALVNIATQLKTLEFRKIFPEFTKTQGVYGFGDLQVENLWNDLKKNHRHLLPKV
ncbi:MAG: hypothetical protein N4A46_14810 [Schleiferiaceae bacterium]|jgi:hypothetical protein|nr:hypothetical protein [Schleiferiaceae bacterium]